MILHKLFADLRQGMDGDVNPGKEAADFLNRSYKEIRKALSDIDLKSYIKERNDYIKNIPSILDDMDLINEDNRGELIQIINGLTFVGGNILYPLSRIGEQDILTVMSIDAFNIFLIPFIMNQSPGLD